jgi:hypothetical protein
MTGSLAETLFQLVEQKANRIGNGAIATQGHVTAVRANGALEVVVGGHTVLATPATEEPIDANRYVWTGQTTDGTTIVFGTSR